MLGRRDVTVRYRQTVLGTMWIFFGALVSAGLFSFVFGRVADLPSQGVPYFVFSYAGLLAWNLFSGTLSSASGSVNGNAGLIPKIYFPRLVVVASSIAGTLVNLVISSGIMLVLLFISGVGISEQILLTPVWLFTAALLAMGLGLTLHLHRRVVPRRELLHRARDAAPALPQPGRLLDPGRAGEPPELYLLNPLRRSSRARGGHYWEPRTCRRVGDGLHGRADAGRAPRGTRGVRPLGGGLRRCHLRWRSASITSPRSSSWVARGDSESLAVDCDSEAPSPVPAWSSARAIRGARRRDLRRGSRRGRGCHRQERRGEEHAAQDPESDHASDGWLRRDLRTGGLVARGRHGIPPRAHRPRERVPQRHDPRDVEAGDRRAISTRSSSSPRSASSWTRR